MGGAQPAESCSAVHDSKVVFFQAHGGIVGVVLGRTWSWMILVDPF